MSRALRSALSELRLYLCNYFVSRVPSHTFRNFFYNKAMGVEIGKDASIFMGAWFYSSAGLALGEEAVINEDCRLDTRGGIQIGRCAVLAAKVTILTADHDPSDPTFQRHRLRAVTVGDYAFVSTGAMILPGVDLGKGCMVGAGAIVTRNVAPFSIVAGCPAREIGKRPENLDYHTKYRRLFH